MTLARPGLALLVATLLALTTPGCGRPPQLGVDPAVFKTVDALYTAMSLKDVALVDQTAGRLDALHTAGRLPDPAFRALSQIIATGKGGDWEKAQTRLNDFMLGQTR